MTKRDEWCVHYNGTQNEQCKAGHSYVQVARPLSEDEQTRLAERLADPDPYYTPNRDSFAIARRIPCFLDQKNECHCPDQRFPTPEEIEEREKHIRQLVEAIGTVRPAIVDHIKAAGRWKTSCAGKIACPICTNGTVHFSYAGSYNGHIHAKCTTEHCVSWME